MSALTLALFGVGIVLLIAGAEMLVRGAPDWPRPSASRHW